MVFEEFGKPVRVTLHPKFTVALGSAALAGLPPRTTPRGGSSATAPPLSAGDRATVPAPTTPLVAPHRKSRIPAVSAAVVVLLVAAVTTLFVAKSGGEAVPARTPVDHSAGTKTALHETLRLYDNVAIAPFTGFIGDATNWTGTEIVQGGAAQTSITATTHGEEGLQVTWAGDEPGQVYLQAPKNPQDLSSYVDSDGALVFDVVVNRAPDDKASLQVHCTYPCRAELPATDLFQQLPAGQRTTVKIPLSCFVETGLDPTKVDTPFLVHSTGSFDATFADVRWVAGAGGDEDTMSCEDLT
jgi:hypothetical protein